MDNKPFDHGFDFESTRFPQGWQVIGYNKAMAQVLDYLKEVTDFRPEYRYIDAIPLIKKLEATFVELKKIGERYEDHKKVNILSGTKPE